MQYGSSHGQRPIRSSRETWEAPFESGMQQNLSRFRFSADPDDAYYSRSPLAPKEPTYLLKAHQTGISSLSVNDAGTRVLSCSLEGVVCLSDLDNGELLAKSETFNDVLASDDIETPPSQSRESKYLST